MGGGYGDHIEDLGGRYRTVFFVCRGSALVRRRCVGCRTRRIQAVGDIGRANIRADVGGIFIGIGLFAIIAAARQDRTWLLAAILLTCGAFLGRFVSVAIDGYSPRVGSPMAVEAIVIAIYLFAYWSWGKKPEGL
jgi:hypothetical protein